MSVVYATCRQCIHKQIVAKKQLWISAAKAHSTAAYHLSQISCWKWLYYFIASCVRASWLTTIKRRLHITVPLTAVVNTKESSKKSSCKKNLLIFVEIVKNPNSGFFQVCEVLIPWGGSLLDLVHNMWILLIKPPYKSYIQPFFVRATLDEG
jgi:hypothetical protein